MHLGISALALVFLDLDPDVDLLGGQIFHDLLEGRRAFVDTAQPHRRQFRKRSLAHRSRRLGGLVEGRIVDDREFALAREVDVEFERSTPSEQAYFRP